MNNLLVVSNLSANPQASAFPSLYELQKSFATHLSNLMSLFSSQFPLWNSTRVLKFVRVGTSDGPAQRLNYTWTLTQSSLSTFECCQHLSQQQNYNTDFTCNLSMLPPIEPWNYRQPGLLCTPRNFQKSSKFSGKKKLLLRSPLRHC
jgi:hypothetical protein